eukprot:332827-Rhodomonas_salina.1
MRRALPAHSSHLTAHHSPLSALTVLPFAFTILLSQRSLFSSLSAHHSPLPALTILRSQCSPCSALSAHCAARVGWCAGTRG